MKIDQERESTHGTGERLRSREGAGSEPMALPFDAARVVHVLRRRSPWLVLLGLVAGVALFLFLPKKPEYNVVVNILRLATSEDLRGDREAATRRYSWLSPQSVAGFLVSPDLMRRVTEKAASDLEPGQLARRVELLPEESSALIQVQIKGDDNPDELLRLANVYAEEFCALTEEVKSKEAREINEQLKGTLRDIDGEIREAHAQRVEFLKEADLFDYDKETDAFLLHRSQLDREFFSANMELEVMEEKIASLKREILLLKRGQIDRLLVRYTESHPVVQDAMAELGTLERQLTSASADSVSKIDMGSPVANGLLLQIIEYRIQKISLRRSLLEIETLRERINSKLAVLSEKTLDYGKIKSRIQSLELTRSMVVGRQREAELIEKYPPRMFRPLRPLGEQDMSMIPGWVKPGLFSFLLASFVFLAGAFLLALMEISDDRIKTVKDLARVSGLPVLAGLGLRRRVSREEETRWAFRTWTLLAGRVGAEKDGSVLVGFASARRGEGVSTWLERLAEAAVRRGFATVVLSLRPGSGAGSGADAGSPVRSGADWLEKARDHLVTRSDEVLRVTVPADWPWTAGHLEQWKRVMEELAGLGRVAVLVELPEAELPEAVPLAAAMPHVVWLAGSGQQRVSEMQMHLETLRSGGCKVTTAVLNREPPGAAQWRLPRWLRPLTAMFFLVVAPLGAQEVPTNAVVDVAAAEAMQDAGRGSNQFFSVFSPRQRAPWQKRLTLGPGDLLNFSLFRDENSFRSNVPIGPDGRISYLQAQDVLAAGLTVDELRALLEEQLSEFYRRPRVIITPVAFRSKKYVVLGAVTRRGVYTLDRPMTIIEAVARAGGLASQSKNDLSVVEMADPSRSFLIRRGEQADLDLESLFFEGDLSQNLPLEPDDFLYVAPAVQNEVYVLGSVGSPGVVVFNERTTLVGAITERGGLASGAYRKKILIVRGSLTRPETYVVNLNDIFKGKTPDFRLQRKDIIYVSSNPWNIVGQVLDMAVRNYLYGVTVAWTSFNVNENIDTKAYIPSFSRPTIKVRAE